MQGDSAQFDRVLRMHLLWLYKPRSAYAKRAILYNYDLRGIERENINLRLSYLSGSILSRVVFINGDFRSAKIKFAGLANTCFRHSDFSGAKLTRSDLVCSDLRDANLTEVDAYRAKFIASNLKNANLQNAYLFGADFTGADIEGASFEGADTRQTKGLKICKD